MLLPKRSIINLQGAIRQDTFANSQFIQKVREEDRRDKILEDVFKQSTEENPYHQKVNASIQLCSALHNEKREEFVKHQRELTRYRDDQDFRQLGYQLRAGYISKAIAAQRFEHEALAIEEKALVHYENSELEKGHWNLVDHAKRMVEKARHKTATLKRDLQEQMAITEAKKQHHKMIVMQEKKMMDEAVKKYQEDQLKEAADAIKKKLKTRAEMEEFVRMQEKWKATQDHGEELRRLRDQEIVRENEKRQLQQIREKKQQREHLISSREEIGKKLDAKRKEELAFDENLVSLLIDERNAKEEAKAKQESERRRREREEANIRLIHYNEKMRLHKIELKQQKAEECRQGMLMMAEVQRQQEMTIEKRRQKILEYRSELLEYLNEKKRFKAEEMKGLIIAELKDVKTKEKRNKAKEACRRKLLKQHAPGLMGYLSPDVLRPSDFEYLSAPSK